MRFHLDFIVPKPDFSINHHQRSFLIGSCFSSNIASKLKDHKFPSLEYPGGILFNPISIANSLSNCITESTVDPKFILQRDQSCFSFLHHSSVQASSQKELIELISTQNKKAKEFLKTADFLFITFGSAYYYQHLTLNAAIANCHKQDAKLFEKRLLSVNEIVASYQLLLKQLNQINTALKVIFTVSPVKYLKDGLIENNLSKSTLVLAIHELMASHKNAYYFPAFELVNDDLRDYRFYKEDLAHPNQQAIDYVWQKFSDCYFSSQTLELNNKVLKLNQALSHRLLHNNSTEASKLTDFIEKQKLELKRIDPDFPL